MSAVKLARKVALLNAGSYMLSSADSSGDGSDCEPSTARWVRLSDPEMRPNIDALRERLRTDPDFAKSMLERAGIVTPTGRLSKRFGG